MLLESSSVFPSFRNELRGFVYQKKLTALSHHNNLVFFSELHDEKEEMEIKVRSFMEDFIPVVEDTLASFVVDLVIDGEGRVWVVEINPFGEMAGSCLFSWSKVLYVKRFDLLC